MMAVRGSEKLSPAEFQQLQDLAAYSNKRVASVLEEEFIEGGCLAGYDRNGDIDFEGFQKFLDCFLEVPTPGSLCRHLFLTFVTQQDRQHSAQTSQETQLVGKQQTTKSGQTYLGGITDKLQQLGRRGDSRASVEGCSANNNHTPEVADKKCLSPKNRSNGYLRGSQQSLQDWGEDIHTARVPLKEISAYLALLEGGTPEDKLEFMFRMYDTDKNGYLDQVEMDSIVDQMMTVADYLGWETEELRPILSEMMEEIDYDSDGTVTLEEWKRGGLTSIPLLVLLGLEQNFKEDGNHLWRLKHFSKPAHCNLCLTMLSGMGRKGLSCTLCKYTVHERCVQRASPSCISTYVKSLRANQRMIHHWVEGNIAGKCSKCRKAIKSYNGITGLHCRWCHMKLHNRCASQLSPECSLGPHKLHVLPPTSICPTVLDRQRSVYCRDGMKRSQSQELPLDSFQLSPVEGSQPLLVFVNPKSGGRQGAKLFRKFLYLLNPRQVYNLAQGGPQAGLHMFRDVKDTIILVCGGDGTVGWVMDVMDKAAMVQEPRVAVIPLGTGNDLARCLRWGGGYEGESLWKVISKISQSTAVMLDRWSITVSDEEKDKSEPLIRTSDKVPYNIINNYFSIGVDAAICSKFHAEREKNPQKFNNRMKNKLWYFEYATSETFSNSCRNLQENLEIICDGIPLQLSGGPSLQGIAILNIPSTHGGTNMWGDSKTKAQRKRIQKKQKEDQEYSSASSLGDLIDLSGAVQDIGDRLIEVVGLESCLHMGQVRTGLRSSGRRLAQCSHIVIRTKKQFPMQIDGEPWNQPPCTIEIAHKNQIPMLQAPPSRSKSFFEFFSQMTGGHEPGLC